MTRISDPFEAADLLEDVATAVRESGVTPDVVTFTSRGHVELMMVHEQPDLDRARLLAAELDAGEFIHNHDGRNYSAYIAGSTVAPDGFVIVAYTAGVLHPEATS